MLADVTNDEELFTAWRAGDRAAGEALIERHFDSLERFFATKAGDAGEDLVQRTLLVCVEKGAAFRADGSFRAFIFGIARNVLHEHIRGRIKHGGGPPDFSNSGIADLSPGVNTLAMYRADQRTLVAGLQRLPLDLQLLIELFYWEELGIDELAVVLEVPPGTIKSRLHRARTLLAEAMEQEPQDDEGSVRALLLDWLATVKARGPAVP
jgi:RNA polymerase sigma-70 factor (ECF subfamily)